MRFRLTRPLAISTIALLLPLSTIAQPSDLPWDPDPDCNCMVTDGIVAVTCGTIVSLTADMQFTFGLVNLNGALPATGRVDVTAQQDMYKHPSWLVEPLGNVFGITMDNGGNIYLAASSNYSSDFFGNPSVIRYGDIGGGAEDLNAAGTIYRIGCTTPTPEVFAVLPQQAYAFTQNTCEGGSTIDRNTGPGLGNITYSFQTAHFYVTNFEDGRIYRLDTLGNILDSYDPLDYDDGTPGPPPTDVLPYGLAIDNENERLFFGTNSGLITGLPEIYSVDLNPDGSFVGTVDNSVMPAGATWDNYVGTDQLHYSIDVFGGFYLHFISDLEFTPAGELLIGKRMGCSNIHSSYNHDGAAIMINDDGTGIYSQYVGNIFTADGVFSTENAYGGVDYFENPNGGLEFVFSSADILSEQGPHGIVTIQAYAFGTPVNPAEPAGAIAYIPGTVSDIKGIGGDVHVFKDCNVEQTCPAEVVVSDLTICSDEPFDLSYNAQGGGNAELEAFWTDANGNPVDDPLGLTLTNSDCAPLTVPYFLTANCVIDSATVLLDTLNVTVYTDDLSPFVTITEDPCFLDVQLNPGCADQLELIGDIPVINPGDSGTVVLQLVQTEFPECNPLEIELNYNCACALTGLDVVTEECEDGTFFVTLDLDPVNAGTIFQVIDQGGFNYGTWEYSQLPLSLGPFEGDASTVYSLTAQDAQLAGCASSVEFGPIYCEMVYQTAVENPVCVEGTGTLTISGVVGGLAPYVYSVDGGLNFSTDSVFTDLLPGDYDIVVQDAAGNEVESAEVVFEPTPVIVTVEPEVELDLGDSYQLNLQTNLAPNEIGSVQWTPATGLSCTDCLNPVVTPVEDITYTVFITDLNGCPAETTVDFRVNPLTPVFVPNIFTPDNDGSNDIFLIFARDGTVAEIRSFLIFSRWGELVFEGYNFMPNDPARGWDGTFRGEPMNPAVFAWYAIVEFMDGRVELLKGDVTLAR